MAVIKSTFKIRRAKLEEWEAVNPIPQDGEPCFAVDANIFKVGDGIHTWNELKSINEDTGVSIIDGNTDMF